MKQLACVASVSVWFRSKEIPRKGTFGFDRERNELTGESKSERGGRGRGSLLINMLSKFVLLIFRAFYVKKLPQPSSPC